MPQDSLHPWYSARIEQWTRCRDAMRGSDAVKAQGRTYLPQPSGFNDTEYGVYKLRTKWFNAARRTRDGLAGLVFRRPAIVDVPEALLPQLENITGTGVAHMQYAQELLRERLTTGVLGTLIDLDGVDRPVNDLRAHWCAYKAEQILSWETETRDDGLILLTMVMLREATQRRKPDDPYVIETISRLRELRLTPEGYTVFVWELIDGKYALVEEPRIPKRQGQSLPFIPFILSQSDIPPLLDVVDLNLSHYQVSADYQHELHWGSIITPVFTGWKKAPKDGVALGSMSALVIPDDNARAFILETSGNGLEAKRQAMDDSKQEMAVLGARMLAPERNAVEATETHAMRQAGEHSILQTYAQEVSAHMTEALRVHAWWVGVAPTWEDDDISYTLNQDYLPTWMAGREVVDLMAAYQGGVLTEEDLYYNLRQGERLQPSQTFEEWQMKRRQSQSNGAVGNTEG